MHDKYSAIIMTAYSYTHPCVQHDGDAVLIRPPYLDPIHKCIANDKAYIIFVVLSIACTQLSFIVTYSYSHYSLYCI